MDAVDILVHISWIAILIRVIVAPLQYFCLENPMDGGAWWAAVHGVAKSQTRLSDFTFTFHFHTLEKEMATHSRDGGAWWAAVCGVIQSQTRLKRLSSSSMQNPSSLTRNQTCSPAPCNQESNLLPSPLHWDKAPTIGLPEKSQGPCFKWKKMRMLPE